MYRGRFDFFSVDDRHVMAVALGPLGEDRGTVGEVHGSCVGDKIEVREHLLPLRSPKCLLVPMRNLCMPSLRLDLDRLFPQLPGTFPEERFLDTDLMVSEAVGKSNSVDEKACFSVCSII